jgi:hypothetical protein
VVYNLAFLHVPIRISVEWNQLRYSLPIRSSQCQWYLPMPLWNLSSQWCLPKSADLLFRHDLEWNSLCSNFLPARYILERNCLYHYTVQLSSWHLLVRNLLRCHHKSMPFWHYLEWKLLHHKFNSMPIRNFLEWSFLSGIPMSVSIWDELCQWSMHTRWK